MARRYKKRGRIRTSWETYSEYYDKIAKKNPRMFDRKYTKEEFERELYLAKLKGIKNPSIEIARSQRQWEYQFERRYKKALSTRKAEMKAQGTWKDEYDINITGQETVEERQAIFYNYVEIFNGNYDEAREAFEALY